MNRALRRYGAPGVLLLADALALLACYAIAFAVRSHVVARIFPVSLEVLSFAEILKTSYLANLGGLAVIFAFERLYTRRLSFWDETQALYKGIALAATLVLTMVFAARAYVRVSRSILLPAWAAAFILFPLFRLLAKKILGRLGLWRRPVLILGTGKVAQLVAREIAHNPAMGYQALGFLSEEGGNVGESLAGLPVFGSMDQAESLGRKLAVRDFVLALSSRKQDVLAETAKRVESFAETIKVVPTLGHLFTMGVGIERIGDVVALTLPRNLTKPANIRIKRTFEFILAALATLLLLPLGLAVAAAIVIDSRGRVLFTQERLGHDGRVFRIFKFRSMFMDAEPRLQLVLAADPAKLAEWTAFQKIKSGDPRVTPVGRLLRRWSVDELPQLLNVLRGDMSLVGPRPYLPREQGIIGEALGIIGSVRPGVTGLWQVRGRNLLTFQDRLLLDEAYVRNWSLWLDIVILLKTLGVLAKGEGAY